ncbi:MAG: 4a-hydroxytetrahydrobiopterin dehydratase [Flavobacteriaceae bacterium]|jgi:4a-hydroxytetrahydrobiopterin dehydratase|tara:strand:- start:808 stop:1107 length:300 start_codon:yes stop_codon:yes gene_type:complete
MAELISKDKLNQKINNLSKNWVIEDVLLKGSFVFKNFDDAFSFMKKVAIKCEDMNHHPKWTNVYNKIDVELYTHDSGGITEKDFELSSYMDAEFKNFSK